MAIGDLSSASDPVSSIHSLAVASPKTWDLLLSLFLAQAKLVRAQTRKEALAGGSQESTGLFSCHSSAPLSGQFCRGLGDNRCWPVCSAGPPFWVPSFEPGSLPPFALSQEISCCVPSSFSSEGRLLVSFWAHHLLHTRPRPVAALLGLAP